jgi:hypothetical protein
MRAGIQDRRALHDIVPYGPVLWPKAILVAAGAFVNSRDLEFETFVSGVFTPMLAKRITAAHHDEA